MIIRREIQTLGETLQRFVVDLEVVVADTHIVPSDVMLVAGVNGVLEHVQALGIALQPHIQTAEVEMNILNHPPKMSSKHTFVSWRG